MNKEPVYQSKLTPSEIRRKVRLVHLAMLKNGFKLVPIVKRLHPNARCVIPLYRSVLVLLRKTEHERLAGSCTIILYHDPHWLGKERNEHSLKQFRSKLYIQGQRSGPDLYLDGSLLNMLDPKTFIRREVQR